MKLNGENNDYMNTATNLTLTVRKRTLARGTTATHGTISKAWRRATNYELMSAATPRLTVRPPKAVHKIEKFVTYKYTQLNTIISATGESRRSRR